MENVTKVKKSRYALLDTIRGMVLVSMMIYHATWNLVYLYGRDWSWYRSRGACLWQQSICWTFILLSGFCFSLARKPMKNAILVLGSGAAVTMTTLLVMPENRVIFGVLTCIGSCLFLTSFGERYLKKVPSVMAAGVNFFLFLITKNINSGVLGLGECRFAQLPESWYENYVTAYLGFPFKKFYSTDYFSLFPWLFLFLTGFYLYEIFYKNGWLEIPFLKKKIGVFSFLGRHSLIIYLLHQPMIYGIQKLLLG